MRKSLIGQVSLLGSIALLGLGLGATQSADARALSATVVSPESPIQHVVIIYQENHTFDDVLGPVCETRPTPCNGYTGEVTLADGTVAPNVVQPDIVPTATHSPRAQRYGLHNEWDRIGGCGRAPYVCVSHVDLANIPNLAALADTYTVSDATYAAGRAASFVAHVSLGGGTYDGFFGSSPVRSKTGVKPREGWGCPSRLDALWGQRGDRTFEPSCIPDKFGHGPYRKSRVPYQPTIMQRMEEAGRTWHIYEGKNNDKPLNGNWSVCTYYAWCLKHRFDTEHDSKRGDFVTAAQAGTLPNLSLLIPTQDSPGADGVSQHNGNSMRVGDDYIGEMVNAVMTGPEWDSTVIFITYDDCGCFYDHVTPPHGLGLRNPMVIISPWAKPGATDSHVAVQPYSALAFTQHLFGLRSISAEVDKAYDYAHAFDFSQQPLAGIPMTTQSISKAERRELIKLAPSVMNDPA
jgi:phospholipase C